MVLQHPRGGASAVGLCVGLRFWIVLLDCVFGLCFGVVFLGCVLGYLGRAGGPGLPPCSQELSIKFRLLFVGSEEAINV